MSPASQSFRFRESRRLLREATVRLSVSGEDGEVSGVTRDIATGGMFVSTPEPMPVGTTVDFVLQLGSDDEPAEVEGEATVVWVRPEAGGADQPAGMGMQFSRVEPPGEERLALLFSEEQTEGDVIPAAPALEAAAEAEGLDDRVEAPSEAVESEVEEEESAPAVEPAEIVEAAPAEEPAEPPRHALPDIDPPLAGREGAGDDEVEATDADLFGALTQDGEDDWMKPESGSRPWLWPAVGAAVLLVALVVFRGPLLRLVGVGGEPAGEATPAEAPSFEVSTPRAAAEAPPEAPPEGVEDPSTTSQLVVPLEEDAAGGESTTDDGDDGAAGATGGATMDSAEPAVPERPLPTAAAETRAEPAAIPPPARPEPAATRPPARPPAAALETPPVTATALRSITARTEGERTVIEIVGNAPFERHHVMPLDAPPRLVVRLIGVGRAYDARAVRGPRLRGVRTGVHGRGATRNLHVVLDLAAADIAATVERRGDRVVVNLSD